MRILNFAYGEFFMIASYVAYFLYAELHLPLVAVLLVTMALLFLVGFGTERTLIFHVRTKIADWSVAVILVTLGLQISLQSIALIFEGGTYRGIPTYIMGTLAIGTFTVSYERLMIFFISLILLGCTYLLINKTKLGLAMLAVSQNREGAILSGINTNKIYSLSFGLSGVLVAVPGVLLMPLLYAYPTVGQVPIMKAFAVTLLGGMGNIGGAMIAGFILGIAETLASAYISALMKDGVAFAIMILILIFYPSGIGDLMLKLKARRAS